MLVVKCDTRRWNFLLVGNTSYFFVDVGATQKLLVRGTCPHRGGPLHLADFDTTSQKLICPWHETGVSVRWLLAMAVPMVRVAHQVTAFLPDSADAEVYLMHRRIKPTSVSEEFNVQKIYRDVAKTSVSSK